MEFSFFSMIAQASLVAKAVLALLVVMSIISWGLMIQKFFSLSAANNKALNGTPAALIENPTGLVNALAYLDGMRAAA